MLKALVVKATINFIVKWRVYFAGELLATFESEQDAHDYAKFINEQWATINNKRQWNNL